MTIDFSNFSALTSDPNYTFDLHSKFTDWKREQIKFFPDLADTDIDTKRTKIKEYTSRYPPHWGEYLFEFFKNQIGEEQVKRTYTIYHELEDYLWWLNKYNKKRGKMNQEHLTKRETKIDKIDCAIVKEQLEKTNTVDEFIKIMRAGIKEEI